MIDEDAADDRPLDPQRTIDPRPGVTVFRNEYGEVCVRQVWSDEVHVPDEFRDFRFVRIPPESAEQVARWIIQVANEVRGDRPVRPL
jgi:hypothetical protein